MYERAGRADEPTLKEASVKRYHYEYESHAELREHLKAFLLAYNHAKRLETLQGLTPFEFVCREWRERRIASSEALSTTPRDRTPRERNVR